MVSLQKHCSRGGTFLDIERDVKTMNDIQVFDNGDFTVRTINDNGEIWFVAKDVLHALGYAADTQPSGQLRNVPEIWTGVKRLHTSSANGVIQEREMLCLTEQGLYFFLGRSDKPKALPYQMWIAGEVLPSIRKTGSYSVKHEDKLTEAIMLSARMILDAAGIKDNQLALALDKVAAHYTGYSLLALSGVTLIAPTKCQLLTPTEIGKHFGISGRKVNETLCNEGYQTKDGQSYKPLELGEPFAVMMDTGKRHSDGTPIRQLKWESSMINEIEDLLGTVTVALFDGE